MNTAIPLMIHYCWFGGNPLPKSAIKCIKSWKRFFPDYEIKEWNESNYDVRKNQYISEAYDAKKYAFVSDYARFDILFHYGGVYFDTDVEVIKSFDDILTRGPFMGCEINPNSRDSIEVAPGLGMAAFPGMEIYKKILDYYNCQSFLGEDGTLNQLTVVKRVTSILNSAGLKNVGGIQCLDSITIYPKDYFNPLNNNTGELTITENTHSIHWYSLSWMDERNRKIRIITRIFHRIFGENCFSWVRRLIK